MKRPHRSNLREFRLIDDLHRALLQRFLIDALRFASPSDGYAIDRREATLADLLANVVIVFDLPHLRHIANHIHPILALLLARREELAVISRRKLHAEPVIRRAPIRAVVDPATDPLPAGIHLHSGLLHGDHDVGRLRVDVRVDVHELVVDSHEVLLHSVEERRCVELSAVFLHVALRLAAAPQPHIHPGNLHSRVHLLVAELMSAVRAEAHRDHAMALRALQLLHGVVASALLVHWKQFALAHAAESHFFLAVRTRQTPVRARESHPALRVALLRRASIAQRCEQGKPIGARFVNVV